jgi:hypothetical protein
MATAINPEGPTAVRIESRILCQSDIEKLWETFKAANKVLNKAFFRLLNPAELGRFEKEAV